MASEKALHVAHGNAPGQRLGAMECPMVGALAMTGFEGSAPSPKASSSERPRPVPPMRPI